MTAMTIVLRLLHIIMGVLWVGGIGLLVMFIMPAVGRTGPTGGQFMQHLIRNTKMTAYLPTLGVVTVLSGFGLFWRDMRMSDGAFAASRSGMTYSIGGLAAVITLFVGGIMTGGSAAKIGKIMAEAGAAGGPPTPEQSQRIAALQARMRLGGRLSFALLLVTVVTMAIGRYV
jgi:hypothetical protein